MQTQSTAPRVVIPGSERPALAGAEDLGQVDPTQPATVTLQLRGKMTDAEMERFISEQASKPIAQRKYLSREELEEMRGATAEDIAKVSAFASQYHLQVVRIDRAARAVTLSGTLGELEKAFGVELHNYRAGDTTFRDYAGTISVPAGVAPALQGVFGLSTRPVARPRG